MIIYGIPPKTQPFLDVKGREWKYHVGSDCWQASDGTIIEHELVIRADNGDTKAEENMKKILGHPP